jgi:hypothetical protein
MLNRESVRRVIIQVTHENVDLIASIYSYDRPGLIREFLNVVDAVIVSRYVSDDQKVAWRLHAGRFLCAERLVCWCVQGGPIIANYGSYNNRSQNSDHD